MSNLRDAYEKLDHKTLLAEVLSIVFSTRVVVVDKDGPPINVPYDRIYGSVILSMLAKAVNTKDPAEIGTLLDDVIKDMVPKERYEKLKYVTSKVLAAVLKDGNPDGSVSIMQAGPPKVLKASDDENPIPMIIPHSNTHH